MAEGQVADESGDTNNDLVINQEMDDGDVNGQSADQARDGDHVEAQEQSKTSINGPSTDAMGGSFPNMNNMGGDLNQMQMMMAMQNGMMPNNFNFSMMGMCKRYGSPNVQKDLSS